MIQDSDTYENENMETWVPNLLKSLKDKKTKVIDATKGMVLLPDSKRGTWTRRGEEHHEYDPTFGSLHIKAEDGRVDSWSVGGSLSR